MICVDKAGEPVACRQGQAGYKVRTRLLNDNKKCASASRDVIVTGTFVYTSAPNVASGP